MTTRAAKLVSMSRNGRFVAVARASAIDLVDALGTAPRATLLRPPGADFACVGTALWIVDGSAIRRWSFDGKAIEPAIELPFAGGRLAAIAGDDTSALVVTNDRAALAFGARDQVRTEAVDGLGAAVWPLAPRRLARAQGDEVRIVEIGRGEVGRIARLGGTPCDAWPLFGGRALAVRVRGAEEDAFVVCRADGAHVHRVDVPRVLHAAVAVQRGTAVIASEDGQLTVVDLRYGRVSAKGEAPIAIAGLDLDVDGQYVVLASEGDDAPVVLHRPVVELFAGAKPARPVEDDRAITPEPARPDAADPGEVVAAAREAPTRPAIPISDALPLGLGRPHSAKPTTAASAREHFDAQLELVAHQIALAIARAWNTGRLATPADQRHPHAREVAALLGKGAPQATSEVADAEEDVRDLARRLDDRTRGLRLPERDLAAELGLSPLALSILYVAMGPQVRGEIARLSAILAADPERSVCDLLGIEDIVGGADPRIRAEVAHELDDGAPLIQSGLIQIGPAKRRLFAPVTVDPVVVERLRGAPPRAGLGDAVSVRTADRPLTALRVDPATLRDVIAACADPRDGRAPLRLALRGRRGSGRTTVIAALAARVGRAVTTIDCRRMLDADPASRLADELARARLRGTVRWCRGSMTSAARSARRAKRSGRCCAATLGRSFSASSPKRTSRSSPATRPWRFPR